MTLNEIQRAAEAGNPLLAYVLRELEDYFEDYFDEDLSEVVVEIPADLLNLTTA
jgi:hypothetical protein